MAVDLKTLSAEELMSLGAQLMAAGQKQRRAGKATEPVMRATLAAEKVEKVAPVAPVSVKAEKAKEAYAKGAATKPEDKEQGGFWESQVLVGMVENSTLKSATKVSICEKDGKQFIDVRKYVSPKGAERTYTQHTTSGISLEVDAALPAIIALVQKAGYRVTRK
jgi:hypothetical protein